MRATIKSLAGLKPKTTEDALLDIAAKAWKFAADAHANIGLHHDAATVAAQFKLIQKLADDEIIRLRKQGEA